MEMGRKCISNGVADSDSVFEGSDPRTWIKIPFFIKFFLINNVTWLLPYHALNFKFNVYLSYE